LFRVSIAVGELEGSIIELLEGVVGAISTREKLFSDGGVLHVKDDNSVGGFANAFVGGGISDKTVDEIIIGGINKVFNILFRQIPVLMAFEALAGLDHVSGSIEIDSSTAIETSKVDGWIASTTNLFDSIVCNIKDIAGLSIIISNHDFISFIREELITSGVRDSDRDRISIGG